MKYVFCLCFLIITPLVQGQSKSTEITNLNKDFAELIKENFNVINSHTAVDSLGHNYLVFKIVPKQKGDYIITHTFSDVEEANSNPTIRREYENVNIVKEIQYESTYILPIRESAERQLYKYNSSYFHNKSQTAQNRINDTIMIPFIICKNSERQEISLRKLENYGGVEESLTDILSKKDTISIDYVNNTRKLELIHFKHFWQTMFHVIRDGIPGISKIYAVFKAKEKGILYLREKTIETPIEIISKETPLTTFYGISCKIKKLYEAPNTGTIFTFQKVFSPPKITVREDDIIIFHLRDISSVKGEKIKLETIVFDTK